MTQIDLKTQVASAVAVRWTDFAAKHPHLAAVIDTSVLIEEAAESLANDPSYQDALAEARTAETGLAVVVSVVDQYVVKLIARLL